MVLNEIVAENLARYGARLHAYCWMTNHLHALMQAGAGPLGPLMQQIARRYARYRQRRMQTNGHLFERRYGARYIDDERYFFAALRYIHLNPVAAGLVADPADYPWSSHCAYLGQRHAPWLTVDFGLGLFGTDRERASQRYLAYLALPDCDPAVSYPPDDGKGRGNNSRVPTASPHERNPRLTAPGQQALSRHEALLQLAGEVCAMHLVTIEGLCSPGKSQCFSAARRELSRRAVGAGIATVGEVAAFLKRDLSTISRLLMDRRPPR